MIEAATGVILRTRPLTETSLIVNWLTRDQGRLSTVAKGARRVKSAFRGKLDLFFVANFDFVRSRRSELHTLREVGLLKTHEPLRHDLQLLQQAAYATRLIEQTVELEAPVPEIYSLMTGFLDALPQGPMRPHLVFAFELKLLQELGLFPELENSHLTAGARQVAHALLNGTWSSIHQLHLSPGQIHELEQFLHGFLIYHLEKLPKGRATAVHGS